jgi:hypothetical protein
VLWLLVVQLGRSRWPEDFGADVGRQVELEEALRELVQGEAELVMTILICLVQDARSFEEVVLWSRPSVQEVK